MNGMAKVALATIIVAAVGCRHRDNGGPAKNPAMKAAEEIAIREVARRTKCEVQHLQAESNKQGDVWRVVVREIPAKPGAFWFVDVTEDGAIKGITSGE